MSTSRRRPRSRPGTGRARSTGAARAVRPPEGLFPAGERTRLPNGARVVVAHTPGLHSAMVALYVRAGSRHEPPEVGGVSHFVEHLLFRGSRGYPDSRAMNAAVESAGGSLNALTARDHTCFYTSIHPGELATGIDVLTDIVRRPLLRDVEVERRVILDEILDEVDSRGRDIDADNQVKAIAFPGHGLGRKIGGTRRTVRALRAESIRDHHALHYTGENVVLVVAGPVAHTDVVALAAPRLGALPRGARRGDRAPPPWPAGPTLRTIEHDDSQVEFSLAFPAPPERHRDHAAALVVRRLLDDGLSSRLPFQVVERQGLAYAVHAAVETFEDAGLFTFEGACIPERLDRVAGEIFRVAADLWEGELPREELDRVKERHRMSLTFALDNPSELVGWFGMGELFGSDETLEARCLRVESVTAADVRRVARAMFRRRNLVGVAVGPGARGLRRDLAKAVSGSPLP